MRVWLIQLFVSSTTFLPGGYDRIFRASIKGWGGVVDPLLLLLPMSLLLLSSAFGEVGGVGCFQRLCSQGTMRWPGS